MIGCYTFFLRYTASTTLHTHIRKRGASHPTTEWVCPKLIAFNASHLDGYRPIASHFIPERKDHIFDLREISRRGFSRRERDAASDRKGWSAVMFLIDSNLRLEITDWCRIRNGHISDAAKDFFLNT